MCFLYLLGAAVVSPLPPPSAGLDRAGGVLPYSGLLPLTRLPLAYRDGGTEVFYRPGLPTALKREADHLVVGWLASWCRPCRKGETL